MQRIIFLSVAFSAVFIFSGSKAAACSCIIPFENPTLKQEVNWNRKNAKAVFAGKVLEMTSLSESQTAGIAVKIKVERFWKRRVPEIITINLPGTSCDFSFESGKSYLIYAYETNAAALSTNLCSGNKELQNAAEDIKLLGKSRKPRKNSFKTQPAQKRTDS